MSDECGQTSALITHHFLRAYSSMAEQAAHNRWVLGSNPSRPIKLYYLIGKVLVLIKPSPVFEAEEWLDFLLNGR